MNYKIDTYVQLITMVSASICVGILGVISLVSTVRGEVVRPFRKFEAECAREIGVTWKDIEEYRSNVTNPSEKILCFLKCKFHANGNLDEYGLLNVELLRTKIDRWPRFTKSMKTELIKCFEDIEVVKVCGDMRKVIECFSEIMFQSNLPRSTPHFREFQVDCAQTVGLTWEDIQTFHSDMSNPSPKIMCYIKCFLTRENGTDNSGSLDLEIISRVMNSLGLGGERRVLQHRECLKRIPPIKECKDTKAIVECLEEGRVPHRHIKCLRQLGAKRRNLIQFEKELLTNSEKNLLYLKCMYQKDSLVDKNGELNYEMMDENIHKMIQIPEKEIKAVPNAEEDRCDLRYNINDFSWPGLKKRLKKTPEDVLCFLNCVYKRTGRVDVGAKINLAMMKDDIEKYLNLTTVAEKSAITCLKGLGPIETCANIKQILFCVTKTKVK